MEGGGAKVVMLTGSVLLLLPVVVFVTCFMFWPGRLIKAYNWFWRRRLGLSVRFCDVGSFRFCYWTRGTPGGAPSLLLLHGFSANKDMWLPVVKFLPGQYHVVCLDLPGHDGTSRFQNEDYSINGQVSRIHQFVHTLGLTRFHLVGASMGGNLAGVYAARFPEDLSSVTMVCPAGLETLQDTDFVKRLKEMETQRNQDQDQDQDQREDQSIALIPTSVPQLQEMLNLCCYKPLNLPTQMKKGLLQNRLPHTTFYRHLFECISAEDSRHSLEKNLHLISVPVQVVWGQQDQVLHVSGASVITAALPHSQVELLENCGHSVALERPRKLATLISNFLSAQEVTHGNAHKKNS
ncbi:monoacylglycerol lipase abhd6-A-like isoform X1 [Boleophthalmus pectinirostris]|uniref:monoacylglycerol lipase abhd6-A-like isoform X1 n=1 Tax=Boleophthalmus pectinirostris TaxID=150288 RepID=UPI0024319CDF|nr:monoacylglycerol lipase abhd6-A-like isoform X1 [Boleophthalmus pectinirostris]